MKWFVEICIVLEGSNPQQKYYFETLTKIRVLAEEVEVEVEVSFSISVYVLVQVNYRKEEVLDLEST